MNFHFHYHHLWSMPPGYSPYKFIVFFKKPLEPLLAPKWTYSSKDESDFTSRDFSETNLGNQDKTDLCCENSEPLNLLLLGYNGQRALPSFSHSFYKYSLPLTLTLVSYFALENTTIQGTISSSLEERKHAASFPWIKFTVHALSLKFNFAF